MVKNKVDIDTFLVDVLRDKCGVDLEFEYYSPRPETASDNKYKDIINIDDGVDICDCTTRALSKALDREYDDVQAEQIKLAKKMRTMPNVCIVTAEIMKKAGWEGEILVDSETIPVAAMIVANPADRYIIGAEGHMVSIVDGVVYDNYKPNEEDPETDIKQFLDIFLTRMCSEFYIPGTKPKKRAYSRRANNA